MLRKIKKVKSATDGLEEFEPFCKWKTEGGSEVLLVYLNGFRKEQLEVIIKRSLIEVNGERMVDKYTKQQFNRPFVIPNSCEAKNIKAKFTGGILSITFHINNNNDKDPADGDASQGSTSIYNLLETSWKVAERLVIMVAFGAYVYKSCRCPYSPK